jgi:hypothetical protein
MRFVGLGRDARTWKKHRAGALHGFVLCEDGRLYHPVIAEVANEAWDRKLRQRHRTFGAAVRKHNERNPDNKLSSPSFEQWIGIGSPERVTEQFSSMSRVTEENVTRDIASKGQGQGQGHIIEEEAKASPSTAMAVSRTDPFPKPEWADAETWRDFLTNRKRKKTPNTATAYSKFLADIARHSTSEWPPWRLLQHATAKGWAGIYEPQDGGNHGQQNSSSARPTRGASTRDIAESVAADLVAMRATG